MVEVLKPDSEVLKLIRNRIQKLKIYQKRGY